MKKVMKQVARKNEPVIVDVAPAPEAKHEDVVAEEAKAEEVVVVAEEAKADEPVAEEAQAEPVAETVEEHVHDESCDHAAEEQAPKRSRKKQADPSDAE